MYVVCLLFLVSVEGKRRTPSSLLGDTSVDRIEDFKNPLSFGYVRRDGTTRYIDPEGTPPYYVGPSEKPKDDVINTGYSYQRRKGEKTIDPTKEESEKRARTGIDYEGLLDKNEARNKGSNKIIPLDTTVTPRNMQRISTPMETGKAVHFARGSFQIRDPRPSTRRLKKRKKFSNWTSCNDLEKDYKFIPKDIMGTEWLPFYTWSYRYRPTAIIHRFSTPTIKLVRNYRMKYENKTETKIDWNAPKLYLQEKIKWLLIAEDRTGLFSAVPDTELPEYANQNPARFPVLKLRLRIFDPYLLMVYCNVRYATVMAINGREPKTNEAKALEASTIPFRGPGKPVSRNIEEESIVFEMERRKQKQLAEATSTVRNRDISEEIAYT